MTLQLEQHDGTHLPVIIEPGATIAQLLRAVRAAVRRNVASTHAKRSISWYTHTHTLSPITNPNQSATASRPLNPMRPSNRRHVKKTWHLAFNGQPVTSSPSTTKIAVLGIHTGDTLQWQPVPSPKREQRMAALTTGTRRAGTQHSRASRAALPARRR